MRDEYEFDYSQAKPNRYAEQIRQGGLMRCCLLTLDQERTTNKPPAKEGDIIGCKWCQAPMVFTRDAWEWAEFPRS
jgi:hypothetical protein